MNQAEGDTVGEERPANWPAWAGCGPLLSDPALQERLDADGYVVVPFLDAHELAAVQALFDEHGGVHSSTFHASFMYDELDDRKAIDEGLRRATKRSVDALFADARVIYGQFMIKPAHDPNPLAVHQDWTLVDEDRFYSAGVWMPLSETTYENGVLHFVRGSHRLGPTWRGPTLPGVFEEIQDEIVARHLTRVDVMPGEAVIHDSRALHWSPPNTTDTTRVAAEIRLVSSKAQLLAYGINADGVVERHEVDDDYYITARGFDASHPTVRSVTPTAIRFVQFEEYQLPQGSSPVDDEVESSVGDGGTQDQAPAEQNAPGAHEDSSPPSEEAEPPASPEPEPVGAPDAEQPAPPGPNTVYAFLPAPFRNEARKAWSALSPSTRERLSPVLRKVRSTLTVKRAGRG